MGRPSEDTSGELAVTARIDPLGSTRTGGTPVPAPIAELLFAPGAHVGRFVIEALLGTGGMSIVYRAHDPRLGRQVALKLLRAALAGQAEILLGEARALAALAHPNVVTVYDAGGVNGHVFLAMEHIVGPTLRDWLDEAPRPWREALEVFLAAGRGLAAAHAAGLVHRDFKPGNVMLGADGRVRVLDFGLAASTRGGGEVVADPAGTPAYMAPEQALGRCDARSDQFSYCVALTEALTGGRPVGGTQPRAPRMPGRLLRALARGLAREPEARHPTMDALLGELARAASRRRRRILAAAVAGAVALAAVALTSARLARPAVDPCAGAGARLAGAWDPARRTAVREAFLAAGGADGERAFVDVARRLDGYARDWTARRADTCAATAVRHEQSAEALDLRMACLDRRLGELRAAAAALAAADAETIERAGDVTATLVPLASCDDARSLAVVARPDERALRARVAELDERLMAARALRSAGKVAAAGDALRPLLAEARALGDRGLIARALRALGNVEIETRLKDAEEHVLEAVALAEATGQDDVKAYALLDLAMLRNQQRRPDAAHLAASLARAAITRLPGDHLRDVVTFLGVESETLTYEGRTLEARLAVELARALAASRPETTRHELAVLESHIGTLFAIEGRLDEARERYERALAYLDATSRKRDRIVPKVENNLASVLVLQGDLAGALAAFQRALAAKELIFGPESTTLVSGLNNVGGTLTSLGRLDEAEPVLSRGLALAEKNEGPDGPMASTLLIELARLAEARKQPDRAIASLEHALRIREARAMSAPDLAEVRLGLGQLLWEYRRDGRARALVASARETYVSVGAKADVEAIDAWRVKSKLR